MGAIHNAHGDSMLHALSLALGVLFATPLAPADEQNLAKAYQDAWHAADRHSDGFYLDTTDEGRDALEHRWELGAQWASAVLDGHAGATPEELSTIALNNGFTLLPLDADSWLVSMGKQEGDFSAFAILKKMGGRFRAVWTSWHDGAADTHYPALQAWSAAGARSDCRDKLGDGPWAQCGPLYSTATLLPKDAKGRARFYVDAGYVQQMGATVGGQLSIWAWDGQTLTPLALPTYSFTVDQTVGARFDGKLLKIREKEEFKTFSSCGGCEGRQVDHVYAIDPDGVHDKGRISMTPELDVLDASLDRLHRNRPVDGLASAQATRAMEAILHNISEPGENPSDFSLGMLTIDRLHKVKGATELCFQSDPTDVYIFTLTKKPDGRLFIAHVRPDSGTQAEPCKGFPKE